MSVAVKELIIYEMACTVNALKIPWTTLFWPRCLLKEYVWDFFFCCTFNEISGFPTRMSKSEKARTKQFECKKKKFKQTKESNRHLVFQPWCLTPVTIVTKSQREVNYLEGTPLCRDQAEIQTTQHGSGTTYSVNAKQYRVPAVKESE